MEITITVKVDAPEGVTPESVRDGVEGVLTGWEGLDVHPLAQGSTLESVTLATGSQEAVDTLVKLARKIASMDANDFLAEDDRVTMAPLILEARRALGMAD
jgi:hypothetical protein